MSPERDWLLLSPPVVSIKSVAGFLWTWQLRLGGLSWPDRGKMISLWYFICIFLKGKCLLTCLRAIGTSFFCEPHVHLICSFFSRECWTFISDSVGVLYVLREKWPFLCNVSCTYSPLKFIQSWLIRVPKLKDNSTCYQAQQVTFRVDFISLYSLMF